jgi:threonine dehydrogenase-like Zn-dependent dehydrogenase
MRAVRLVEAHRLELVRLPEPEPGPGQVTVRVNACGICGSDLSSYKAGLFLDAVPGHEVSGLVEATGTGVEGWSAGDRVSIHPMSPCGHCADCRAGAPHRCQSSLGGSQTSINPGGLAEVVAAPTEGLHRLPAGLPVEDGCLSEPLAVAIHGARRAGARPGEAATVVGLGSIGLLAVAALNDLGASPIFGIDPVGRRRELACRLGAAATAGSTQDAMAEFDQAPLVMECSGRPEMVQAASDLAISGGRVGLLGIAVSEVVTYPLFWITRELTLTGAIASGRDDMAAAVDLLGRRPEIGGIITRRVSLAETPAVFESLIAPKDEGKVAVDPRLA